MKLNKWLYVSEFELENGKHRLNAFEIKLKLDFNKQIKFFN